MNFKKSNIIRRNHIQQRSVLTEVEQIKIINFCKERFPWIVPPIEFLLQFPIRCGDLVDLKLSDLDKDKKVISYRERKSGNKVKIRMPLEMEEHFLNRANSKNCKYLFTRPGADFKGEDMEKCYKIDANMLIKFLKLTCSILKIDFRWYDLRIAAGHRKKAVLNS